MADELYRAGGALGAGLACKIAQDKLGKDDLTDTLIAASVAAIGYFAAVSLTGRAQVVAQGALDGGAALLGAMAAAMLQKKSSATEHSSGYGDSGYGDYGYGETVPEEEKPYEEAVYGGQVGEEPELVEEYVEI
ncbi:MAG: hypothetical protein ACUVRF_09115 [Desulfotomaculales bacterium]